jgi:hypothetical protein
LGTMALHRAMRGTNNTVLIAVAACGVLFFLPTIPIGLFTLLHFCIPAIVVFYLYKWPHGGRYIGGGLVFAIVLSAVTGTLPALLFSAILIPCGFSLAYAAFAQHSVIYSGLRGFFTLGLCWLVLLGGIMVITGTNPFSEQVVALELDREAIIDFYASRNVPVPAIFEEQNFAAATQLAVKIFPSLIVNSMLFIIWISLMLSNRFVTRYTPYRPWPPISSWHLPERFIWGFIVSVVCVLLPSATLKILGINGCLVFSLLYFFQGFSVVIYFINKWKVPVVPRFMIYTMMLFTLFGSILLLIVVGVADTWLTLRKPTSSPPGSPHNPAS